MHDWYTRKVWGQGENDNSDQKWMTNVYHVTSLRKLVKQCFFLPITVYLLCGNVVIYYMQLNPGLAQL